MSHLDLFRAIKNHLEQFLTRPIGSSLIDTSIWYLIGICRNFVDKKFYDCVWDYQQEVLWKNWKPSCRLAPLVSGNKQTNTILYITPSWDKIIRCSWQFIESILWKNKKSVFHCPFYLAFFLASQSRVIKKEIEKLAFHENNFPRVVLPLSCYKLLMVSIFRSCEVKCVICLFLWSVNYFVTRRT